MVFAPIPVADQALYTEDDYDGLGRKTKTQAPSGSCVFTIYDGMARAQSVSNPGACGSGSQFTTTAYDDLGRSTSVATPDAAATKAYYRGPLALVVDPAGKTRQSSTDALGRLAQVIENQTSFQTSGGTISVGVSSEPVLTTNYSYDTLDNLAAFRKRRQRLHRQLWSGQSRGAQASEPLNGVPVPGRSCTASWGADAADQNLTHRQLPQLVVSQYP